MPRKKQTTPRKQSSRKYSTPNQKAITLVPGDDHFVDYRIQTILTSQVRYSTAAILCVSVLFLCACDLHNSRGGIGMVEPKSTTGGGTVRKDWKKEEI